MKLVLIHGRAQAGRSADEIRNQWLPGLHQGLANAGVDLGSSPDVEIPFYGDVLESLTGASGTYAASVVTRGTPPTETVDPLTAAMVLQMAVRAGIDPEEVYDEEELAVVERGPERWGWVQALARKLEDKFPWLAELVVGQVTQDVKAYIDFPHIQDAVHDIVAPAIGDEPCVILSHSLGTVVAYWVLARHCPNADVRLLLTAGSPLGLDAIKDRLPHPLGIPSSVQRWLNVTDEEDVVALHARLDGSTFVGGIENLTDIENGDEPHAIERYLADRRVGRAIYTALT
jgi:hypothetical protein